VKALAVVAWFVSAFAVAAALAWALSPLLMSVAQVFA
jgi:hypothetical protein